MGTLYFVTPVLTDEAFAQWMGESGIELTAVPTSRFPSVREIRDTLAQLDGYSFEASTFAATWEAEIFERGRTDDRWTGEWADLIVMDYHGDDDTPLSFYFSRGYARLNVLVTQQFTKRCGPLVVMPDTCGIPLLITPDTVIDQAIQVWDT